MCNEHVQEFHFLCACRVTFTSSVVFAIIKLNIFKINTDDCTHFYFLFMSQLMLYSCVDKVKLKLIVIKTYNTLTMEVLTPRQSVSDCTFFQLVIHYIHYRLAGHFVTNLILMNQLNNHKAKETKTGFPFQF